MRILNWTAILALFPWLIRAGEFEPVGRIFAERCLKCHGDGAKLQDLDLSTESGLLKGGKSGPVLVPGMAVASLLYAKVGSGQMPPTQRLDTASIQAVRKWIDAGAKWEGPASLLAGKRADAKWWAFQPIGKTTPPRRGNPIDAFLLAALEAKGLGFQPAAGPRSLIRRLSFDLTGLPPAPEDESLTYEQAIEKYLASPRYGERWGRHWLDVVRFGETDGGEHNFERFNAWPYRDWVIESLNADKPYDQFIREQIAGDVLRPDDPKAMAATGFLVAGPWDQVSAVLNKDEGMKAQARMDELDDMVTTTAHSFLGLTVNCARCHDHKFDPIPTRDYYRMTSFFAGVGFGEIEIGSEEEKRRREDLLKPLRKQMDVMKAQVADIEDPRRVPLLIRRYQEFDGQRAREPRRIPVNPAWNRNEFAPITAQRFRFVAGNQVGRRAKLNYLEVLPPGKRFGPWVATDAATADKPQSFEIDLGHAAEVREIRFASDPEHAVRDGMPSNYRFEAFVDGQWRAVASSMDHVGGTEVDLPELSPDEVTALLTPSAREHRARVQSSIAEVQAKIDQAPQVTKLYSAKPREMAKSHVLERGNVKRPGEEVLPAALSAVGGDLDLADAANPGARRVALANWIATPRNPLTARVIVNRVWFHHFGNGIVNTPSDFGFNGDRPSHPELLDWLAAAFMENGWSLKWLHRQILTSGAYKQGSALIAKADAVDAGNRLIWRMPLKRMDAETLRDSILAVAGNLNLKMGGPSYLLQKKGSRGSYIYAALANDGPEVWRRAVYRFVVRGGERIMLDSFDCPDPSVATPQRAISNTPVQALTLLNNEFVIRQAGLFADRLQREAPDGRRAQVAFAYRLLYGRQPTDAEYTRDLQFMARNDLSTYARALLNSNEFVYVP